MTTSPESLSGPVELVNPVLYQIAHDELGSIDQPIYTILNAGMGCLWYIRRKSLQSGLEFFFMHSDDWGQYSPQSDSRPRLNQFIEGFSEV